MTAQEDVKPIDHLFASLRRRMSAKRSSAKHIIRPEFDAIFYKSSYPEVTATSLDGLISDYCNVGWQAGRDPSPDFSTSLYLQHNPDVFEAQVNPFEHWILFGRAEGRRRDPSGGHKDNEDKASFTPPPIFSQMEQGRWHPDDHDALWDDLAPAFPYGIAPGPVSAALMLFMASGDTVPETHLRDALIYVSGPVTVFLPSGSERPALDESVASRVRFVEVDGLPTSADLQRAIKGLTEKSIGILDCNVVPAVSAWRLLDHSFDLDPDCLCAGATLHGATGIVWRSGARIDPNSLGNGNARVSFRNAGTFCLDPEIFRQRPSAAAEPAMSLFRAGALRTALKDIAPDSPLPEAIMAASAGMKTVTQGCALACADVPPTPPAQLPTLSEAECAHLAPATERIVFVDSVPPQPDQDAGSVTAWNFLEIFRDRGSEILFYSTSNRAWDAPYALALAARGIACLTNRCVANYDGACEVISRNTPSDAASLHFILTRVHAGGEVIERTRAMFPQASVIFNTVDLHGLRELREAKLSGSLAAEFAAQRTVARENQVIQLSDATILLSEAELAETSATLGHANLKLIPMINELSPPKAGFSERNGLLFIGGFAHFPNRDAVQYLIDALWGPMRAKNPELTLKLIGPHFPAEMAARLPEGVTAIGYVEDLASELEKARLTIAPLRYGAGIKGKIGTSLGHGVPCIATPLAAEGMGLAHGQEVMIAESPEDFAAATAAIYGDPDLWAKMSKAGYDFCEARYSRRAVAAQLNALLDEVQK